MFYSPRAKRFVIIAFEIVGTNITCDNTEYTKAFHGGIVRRTEIIYTCFIFSCCELFEASLLLNLFFPMKFFHAGCKCSALFLSVSYFSVSIAYLTILGLQSLIGVIYEFVLNFQNQF